MAAFCTNCGTSMDPSSAFCARCGAAVAPPVSPVPVAPAVSGNTGGPSVARPSLDLGKVLSDTFDSYKADTPTHLLATLVTLVLSSVSLNLLAGTMQVGYMRMMDKRSRGEAIEVGDVFSGFDSFPTSLALMILWGIMMAIGIMLCVIPALLVAPLGPIALYLVAKGESNPVTALQRAWDYVRPELGMAVLGSIALGVIGSIGAVACYVGIFLTLPVLYIGGYHMARQLVDARDAPRG